MFQLIDRAIDRSLSQSTGLFLCMSCTPVDWAVDRHSPPVDRVLSWPASMCCLLPLSSDLCATFFYLLSSYNLHLGEDFSNLRRTLIYHLAKSTHDFGLSAPNEIDTRSWRNRHTISSWPTDETCSFKLIASTRTINFH